MIKTLDAQIAHLEELVVMRQRRLRVLETQCARFGNHVPSHLVIEKEDVEHELEKTFATLQNLRCKGAADYDAHTAPGEPTAYATSLKRRSFSRYYLALLASMVAGTSVIFLGIYAKDRNIALGMMLMFFAVSFSLWYFSPVNNNSPSYRKYRKDYLQHLIYCHRDFDVKGLSTRGIYNIEQERVFVSLGLSPQPLDRISAGLIHVIPEALRSGDHDIWAYLRSYESTNRKFAIVGSPGSGKTTLLKHITLTFASGSYRRLRPRVPNRTPILLLLRDHAERISSNPLLTLSQVIHRSLAPWNHTPPQGWFETELRKNRCIVLLDGLDEVADIRTRKQVVAWIERQMQIYPKNTFLITSRPIGYRSNPLSGVHVLEVRSFTSDQVKRFVENWYHAIEVMSWQKDDAGVRMRAAEGAEDLLRRLSNAPALTELAANPLLLTMIATIHRYRSRLPGRRVELYTEICEVFLGKRRQSLDLDLDLAPIQKQRVIEPLAYHMMRAQQREISIAEALQWIEEPLSRISVHIPGADFLKMIEESSGLLLERENGIYSFAHQTFQEYLAAVHIQEQRLLHDLLAQVENSWWHETILLYAARSDASPIIETCIEHDKPSINGLVLAIGCLNEALAIRPALRLQVERLLLEEVEDTDPQRRRIVAEALVTQRLRRVVRLNDRRYIDTALVTHAEYQLFLDERREQGLYYQPDHWAGTRFPAGQGHTPVIGVRPTDAEAFCAWLTERDRGGHYQVPLAEEGQVYTKEGSSPIGYWVRADQGFSCEGMTAADTTNIKMALAYRIADDFVNLQLYALTMILSTMHREARDLVNTRLQDRDIIAENDRIQALVDHLTLAQALVKTLVGALDQSSAHELTVNLSDARGRAIASALDLASALEAARASAQGQGAGLADARAREQARLHALLTDRARASALMNIHSLAGMFSRAIPHVQTLQHALAADVIENQELKRHFEAAEVHRRDLLDALVYAGEPTRAQLLAYMRPHIYIPRAELFRAFVRNHPPLLDHAYAMTCMRAFDRAPAAQATNRADMTLQRAYLRYWALMCSAMITHAGKTPASGDQRLRGDQQKQWTRMQMYYGLYLDLALLEERIAGTIPAVEGIRIVKELPEGPEAQ